MNIYKTFIETEEDITRLSKILNKNDDTNDIILFLEKNSLAFDYQYFTVNDKILNKNFKIFLKKLINNEINLEGISKKNTKNFEKNIKKLQSMKKEGYTVQDIILEYDNYFLEKMFLIMLEQTYKKDIILFNCGIFEETYGIISELNPEFKKNLILTNGNVIKKIKPKIDNTIKNKSIDISSNIEFELSLKKEQKHENSIEIGGMS
jgi:hypothetical protein